MQYTRLLDFQYGLAMTVNIISSLPKNPMTILFSLAIDVDTFAFL